jgi:acyl carrier protein
MSLTSLHASSRTSELASLFHGKSNEIQPLSQVASWDFPAFVFFTSGSTGTPQAVSMSHQFILLDIARQINDLAIRPVDRFDLLFSPNFSAFLAPTFGAILTGASLWIRSLDQSIPTDLIDWLIDSEITISTMSVSVMRALFEQLPKGGHWPSLRILSVGAEPLRSKDVLLFHDKTCDQAILQNAMATTETRTYAQYFFDRNQTPGDPIPIGHPVLNRHVEILDDRQIPVALGQVGHIRISSELLATGNRLEGITRFDSSDLGYFDENGLLYCVGREDSMVKIRGQKVYLNQIETEILRVKNVSNAFVFTLEATPNNALIIACIESVDPTVQDAVYDQLRKQLPPIAYPSRLNLFEHFPRTSTGKIDRQGLIQSVTQNFKARSSIFSNSDTLSPLCELLASFLAKPIQPTTRIKSLGIDSIQSLDLCIRIEKKFSRRINSSDIHSCETCIQLEELIRSAPVCEPFYWVKPPAHERPTILLFTSIAGHLQQFNPLIEHLLEAQPSVNSYGIAVVEAGRLHLPQDREVSIASFAEHLLKPVLDHVKRTPLILAGHSWGGLIAFELACQIQKNGQSIKNLVLIDTIMRKGVSSKILSRWSSRVRNFPNWFLHEAIQMKPDDWIRESVKSEAITQSRTKPFPCP